MAVKPISLKQEYEKNSEISPDDIKLFRDWLMSQPHLPGELIDDVELIVIFHCCERNLTVAKKILDLNYTFRTAGNFFKNRVVNKQLEICLNTILLTSLPEPTNNGERIFYAAMMDPDPKKFDLVDTAKLFMMIFDLHQSEMGTIPGGRLILNMDKVIFSHFLRLEISVVRNILYFVQECMFVKLRGVHFMNAPYFMDKIMMLLKPFLKKALLDIIYIHPVGDTNMYKTIPQKILPRECGGEYFDYKTIKEDTIHRLRSNTEFFENEMKKRVQESLRPDGKGAIANKSGVVGSFKKLDID